MSSNLDRFYIHRLHDVIEGLYPPILEVAGYKVIVVSHHKSKIYYTDGENFYLMMNKRDPYERKLPHGQQA